MPDKNQKRLRILMVNNYHYERGGSEKVYLETGRIFELAGHEVAYFACKNKRNQATSWSKFFVEDYNLNGSKSHLLQMAFKFLYNRQARRNIRKLIEEFKPQVAHLHNIYHHLSPAIILELKKQGIPMVMTLHDYKLVCPNYRLFTKNEICYRCKGGKYYQCFLNKCIKNSRSKSLLAMLEAYLHNKILKTYEKVDIFISPSRFLKNICVDFGIDKNKIKVIYNFTSEEALSKATKDYLLYFGRLTHEKGVDVLLEALTKSRNNYNLKIAGEGDLRLELELKAKNIGVDSQVDFVGYKRGEELHTLIKEAKAIIAPSVWLENMPLSMIEAMSMGKIIIASKLGGLSEIIRDGENGFLVKANSPEELAEKIDSLSQFDLSRISLEAHRQSKQFKKDDYYNFVRNTYFEIIS